MARRSNLNIDALAREYTDDVVETAADIMKDPLMEPRDRLRAAEFLAERGHGKASQAIIALPMTRKLAQQLYAMSNEELLAVIGHDPGQLSAPAQAGSIDAEYTTVDAEHDPLLD